MIEILLLTLFILHLLNYLYFLFKIFKGLKKLKPHSNLILPEEFITVIVPFRNESENILKCLQSLTSQNYPQNKFEIIFVNDHSIDDSFQKIDQITKPKNVKVLNLKSNSYAEAYKKQAIAFALDNSKGEIIVTTDADCTHNENWLTTLVSIFDNKTGFVSGPVIFKDDVKPFSKIQSLDFAGIILAGAGLISIGKPTISNGANLAFRKSVYYDLGGYSDQMHLTSGEDEILMQKIVRDTNYKVKFCWSKEAVVNTIPNKNLSEFLQQRKRWASKGIYYKSKILILILIMIYLFYVGLFAQLFLSIFASQLFAITFFISILAKIILEFAIISKGKDFLFPAKLLRYFFITEVFQITYLVIAGISGLLGNFKWKGRNITR